MPLRLTSGSSARKGMEVLARGADVKLKKQEHKKEPHKSPVRLDPVITHREPPSTYEDHGLWSVGPRPVPETVSSSIVAKVVEILSPLVSSARRSLEGMAKGRFPHPPGTPWEAWALQSLRANRLGYLSETSMVAGVPDN